MKISQTEARKHRADANRLRETLRAIYRTWRAGHVCATCIGSMTVDAATMARIQTAGTLNHAVVVTYSGDRLYFHAMPAPQEPTP